MAETPASPSAEPTPVILHEPPRGPNHWLREAVVILVSVALGFAASEFGQYRQERGLAQAVLRSMTDEVRQNETALSAAVGKHREWEQALRRADVSATDTAGFRALIDSRPDGAGSIVVPLSSAAWQMAMSSGALRLLDFEVGGALSEIYTVQTLMHEHHNRTVSSVLYTPASFDPAARAVATKVLWAVMSEVAGNEESLVELYRKHLPLLQRASDQ